MASLPRVEVIETGARDVDELPLHPRPVPAVPLLCAYVVPAHEARNQPLPAALHPACGELQSVGCSRGSGLGAEGARRNARSICRFG